MRFWRFFRDMGLVAWVGISFAMIVLLTVDWSFESHQHAVLSAFIFVIYFMLRFHQVWDKEDILLKIEELKSKKLKNEKRT